MTAYREPGEARWEAEILALHFEDATVLPRLRSTRDPHELHFDSRCDGCGRTDVCTGLVSVAVESRGAGRVNMFMI